MTVTWDKECCYDESAFKCLCLSACLFIRSTKQILFYRLVVYGKTHNKCFDDLIFENHTEPPYRKNRLGGVTIIDERIVKLVYVSWI